VRASDTSKADNESLAEQVAVGALKYQILKHGIGSNIVFDKDQALSFEGNSGPYLQYTHARICSALAKASEVGVVPGAIVVPETPYILERMLYRFPEVVEKALEERAPHFVATYLTELASAFNAFYAHEKIADASDQFAPYKVTVATAVAHTLKNGLWVLGIKSPEKM
jgi:arginyl-tRNA synthetase